MTLAPESIRLVRLLAGLLDGVELVQIHRSTPPLDPALERLRQVLRPLFCL